MEILELIHAKLDLMSEPDIHIVVDEISISENISCKELLSIYDSQDWSFKNDR